jgi:hypothetical protein
MEYSDDGTNWKKWVDANQDPYGAATGLGSAIAARRIGEEAVDAA